MNFITTSNKNSTGPPWSKIAQNLLHVARQWCPNELNIHIYHAYGRQIERIGLNFAYIRHPKEISLQRDLIDFCVNNAFVAHLHALQIWSACYGINYTVTAKIFEFGRTESQNGCDKNEDCITRERINQVWIVRETNSTGTASLMGVMETEDVFLPNDSFVSFDRKFVLQCLNVRSC